MTARCASCDLTIAAAGLRAQAELLDALDRPEAATRARAEADRLDAAPCCWWWRSRGEVENPETGQVEERVAHGCGKALLPRFLSDFGHSTLLAAKSVQTATAEAQRVADRAATVAVAVDRLEAGIARHSERVELAASAVAGLLTPGR